MSTPLQGLAWKKGLETSLLSKQCYHVQKALFEVVQTSTGAVSIRNNRVNETMHNPVGPWVEANSLYIEQSKLKERLSQSSAEELVIFDVGLGAAANALAALHCWQSVANPRALRIISFERDLDLLRFALENARHFEHFQGYENALSTLLSEGRWSRGMLSWELRAGDFVELLPLEKHKAHVVFFDPYSPQMNQEMWTLDIFKELRLHCVNSEEGAVLLTYSKATPIRTALLCAGFYVGAGRGTGEKDETTFASTCVDELEQPFAARWLERWKNSSARYPLKTKDKDKKEIENLILKHPQFLKL